MPMTTEEVASFALFAQEKLNNGGVESLEQCLFLWREHVEVNAGINRGLAEADASLGTPLREFMTEFRQRHGHAGHR